MVKIWLATFAVGIVISLASAAVARDCPLDMIPYYNNNKLECGCPKGQEIDYQLNRNREGIMVAFGRCKVVSGYLTPPVTDSLYLWLDANDPYGHGHSYPPTNSTIAKIRNKALGYASAYWLNATSVHYSSAANSGTFGTRRSLNLTNLSSNIRQNNTLSPAGYRAGTVVMALSTTSMDPAMGLSPGLNIGAGAIFTTLDAGPGWQGILMSMTYYYHGMSGNYRSSSQLVGTSPPPPPPPPQSKCVLQNSFAWNQSFSDYNITSFTARAITGGGDSSGYCTVYGPVDLEDNPTYSPFTSPNDASTGGQPTSLRVVIGKAGSSSGFVGKALEALFYTRELNAGEIAAVQSYLRKKWNL